MIIHDLHKFPEDWCDNCGLTISSLPMHELQPLIDRKVDEIWYWYAKESKGYGKGYLLARKGTLYMHLLLEHYFDDPIVIITGRDRFKTFSNLQRKIFLQYRTNPLFQHVIAKYGKPSFNRKKLFVKSTL